MVLTHKSFGPDGVDIVCLHWLGGTAETWAHVAHDLVAQGLHTIAIDLPAFGGAAHLAPQGTEAMAISVEKTIASLRGDGGGYVLVGHSMGGKVASVMARRAEAGIALSGAPKALILISPSPPSPEPMNESKRADVQRNLGEASRDDASRASYAQEFVRESTGKLQLEPEVERNETNRMLTSSPRAFDLWMESSSKEDLSEVIGMIGIPALVLAGTEDASLGPKAQREHMLPRLAVSDLQVLEGAGHLAPLERPSEVAFRIACFLRSLGLINEMMASPHEDFALIMKSDSTSPQTRRVMEARLADEALPTVFGVQASATLDALIRCVLPSANQKLMRRLETLLSSGEGDGWRFDVLPTDLRSWKQGLQTLDHAAIRRHGVNFSALPERLRGELLVEVQAGDVGKGLLGQLHLGKQADDLNGEQMKVWFEDVRGELSKLYASDPTTMDRIGFTGFADEKGFELVELNASKERT